MKLMIIIFSVVLCGCGGMKNEDFVKECDFCVKSGYECRRVQNAWDYSTIRVACIPKTEGGHNGK